VFDGLRRRLADAVLATYLALAPSHTAEWRLTAIPPAVVLAVGEPMRALPAG